MESEPFSKLLVKYYVRIARTFCKAKKQYAILRGYQEEVYGTRKAFILSVITR